MFDTHCHLNFKAFKKILPDVIHRAHFAGVSHILIPGTDVKTSEKATELAQTDEHFYAAVGIHPHHAYKIMTNIQFLVSNERRSKRELIRHMIDQEVAEIERLLSLPKVVSVGEVGMDRHEYQQTVYGDYAVNDDFIEIQKILFQKQIALAIRHDKSLIIHNREAKADLLPILHDLWDDKLRGRSVFHCCEPDDDILTFVKDHGMYTGVDGDITYSSQKQEFIKKVPLDILVLETDSPFLLPEPLRSQKKYPNEPAHMHIVAETIGQLKNVSVEQIITSTMEQSKQLFSL